MPLSAWTVIRCLFGSSCYLEEGEGMDIRCLVLDIDGTLLRPDETLGERTFAAVAAVQNRGIAVTLATGRRLQRTLPWIRRLGVTLPVAIHNGAVIYDPVEAAVIKTFPLDQEVVDELIEDLRESGVHFVVYNGHDAGDSVQMEDRIWNSGRELLAMYLGDGAERVTAHHFSVPPLKIALVGERKIVEPKIPFWRERYGRATNMMVFYSSHRHHIGVEFIAPEVSKATAVRWILAEQGWSFSQAMCIGDDINDKEMIQAAAIGVAMGNADPRLHAAARYRTSGNHEDGAGQAIEKLLLNNESKAR